MFALSCGPARWKKAGKPGLPSAIMTSEQTYNASRHVDGFGKAEEPFFATRAASIDRTLRGPVCRGGVIRDWAAKTARAAQAGRKGSSVVLPELDEMTAVEQRSKDLQLLKAHLRPADQAPLGPRRGRSNRGVRTARAFSEVGHDVRISGCCTVCFVLCKYLTPRWLSWGPKGRTDVRGNPYLGRCRQRW